MRQAFYHIVGVHFEVKESFIEWSESDKDTYWSNDNVKADPTHVRLLDDPLYALSHFLPQLKRPHGASDLDWNNHIFGLTAIICDYISMLRGQTITSLLLYAKEALLSMNLIVPLDKHTLKEARKQAKLKKERLR